MGLLYLLACIPRSAGPSGPAVLLAPEGAPLQLPQVTEVLSFQWHAQPDPSFDGIIDTTLREDFPDDNFGGVDPYFLEDLSGARKRSVLAWTIDLVPPGSEVISAVASLKVVQTASDAIDVYPLLRDWDWNLTTWNCALLDAPGGGCVDAWEVPGAAGTSDRGLRMGTFDASALEWSQVVLNKIGLESVQRWVDVPSSNYGLLLEGTGHQAAVRSNDAPDPDDRPVLTVEFVPSASRCPAFAPVTGIPLSDPVSGLVAARDTRNEGRWFTVVADSDAAEIRAIDGATGTLARTFDLGVAVGDLEGIAIGRANDTAAGSYLTVGDIGEDRANAELRLYRVQEPDLASASDTLAPTQLEAVFPDWDPAAVASGLFGDLDSADLYVPTDGRLYLYPEWQQDLGGTAELFIWAPIFDFRSDTVLDAMGVAPSERAAWQRIRGGTFAPDGWLAVRTEQEIWLFLERPGEPPLGRLSRAPDCAIAIDDPGGSAIGLAPNDVDLWTSGPGDAPVITRWIATD